MLRIDGDNTSYIDPSAADVYHQYSNLQFVQSCRFIDEVSDFIVGPVLDVGCGDGKVTKYLADTYHLTVTGLDISKDRVALANQLYGSPQVRFELGNALVLNDTPLISHQHYQTVVSFNAIHHLPSTQQLSFFRQVRDRLDEDGRAVFLIPGLSEYHESIRKATVSDRWKEYFADFDLSAVRTYESGAYYCELASEAGFQLPCQVTEGEEPGVEMDFNELKKYFAGWLPHLAHLRTKGADDEMQDEFLNDMVAMYFEKQKIEKTGKVNPSVWQNKMVFFKSRPVHADEQNDQALLIDNRLC